MDTYGEWHEPVHSYCLAWREVRLDGGGFMTQSCMREAGHDGEHRPLPVALPSVSTATWPGVVSYTV